MTKTSLLQLAQKLRGLNTVPMIESALHVDRTRAIYIVHQLRKRGFVKTNYQSDKTRVYHISPQNVLGGTSYIDILNRYSPLQLLATDLHYIHGREPSIEETLLYAIKRRDVRYTIASLALFRKIKSWGELYNRAKEENLVREVAALYAVSRLVVSKVKRMPQRFKTLAMPKKSNTYVFIIKGLDSMDFKSIERKWKVYIPLNYSDLAAYAGVFT
ncbi:MAG TPA: hypothetical protein VJK51_04970 [Candidatus Nanoarchaeia archaeon]|nr:hypothetical protein [Candidatus Nanoarchaeia archaeon]